MFWERFYEMCEQVKGKKPNAIREDILVSSSVISKWKKGECLPNGETLKRIADYLDCSVDYLLGRTDDPQAHKRRKLGQIVIDLDALALPIDEPANPSQSAAKE